MGSVLTNSMAITGRLGMCSKPSSNIGNDTADANAAGSMNAQYLLNQRSLPVNLLNPHCDELFDILFVSVATRRRSIYTKRIAAKERKAIVRAGGG